MVLKTSCLPSDLGFIEFRDPWLQDLLWQKVNPREFYQTDTYTKVDMMKHLEQMNSQGLVYFWGSKTLGLVMRINVPNRYVIEPHLLGDVSHWRTLQPVAMDFAFNGMGIRKINVYTPFKAIKGVLCRYGFDHEGTLTNTYIAEDGTLHPYFILGLNKEKYAQLSQVSPE